jgi:hypothetical protein
MIRKRTDPFKSVLDRFLNKVNTANPWNCWEWNGAKTRFGYGMISFKKRAHLAHRISWSLVNGEIPFGMCVLHVCDNPSCVNPHHLFLGTQEDNVKDRDQKRRRLPPIGTFNGRAKLTEQNIVGILEDSRYQKVIAKDYGVGQSQIGRIKRGEAWKGVTLHAKD